MSKAMYRCFLSESVVNLMQTKEFQNFEPEIVSWFLYRPRLNTLGYIMVRKHYDSQGL